MKKKAALIVIGIAAVIIIASNCPLTVMLYANRELSSFTKLMLDVSDGDATAVRRDLESGANPNAKSLSGETAMAIALCTSPKPKNREVIVGLLIDHGASANEALGMILHTEYTSAERFAVTKVVIARHADVNKLCPDGTTPLSAAKIMDDGALIKLLKRAGAKQ